MLVKLEHNEKHPPLGEKMQLTDDPLIARQWIKKDFNIGLRLRESKRVVADFDGLNHENGKEVAREFYEKYRKLFKEPPRNIAESPSGGIHFHFEGELEKSYAILDSEGRPIGDVKATGHIVVPPSVVGKPYKWLRQGPIQPFPAEMFPIIKKTRDDLRNTIDENDPVRRLMRARAWMKHREGKKDGQGRGLQMIKTCRALFGLFGLTEDQVWPLILEFNERCVPPYTEKQLRHKIEDSQKGE